jgi:hypothetical protein
LVDGVELLLVGVELVLGAGVLVDGGVVVLVLPLDGGMPELKLVDPDGLLLNPP